MASLDRRAEIMSALKAVSDSNVADENTFDILMKLLVVSKQQNAAQETVLCEEVLGQLVVFLEVDARERISEQLSSNSDAPHGVVKFLAFEPIRIAQPVLAHSPVLQDNDLIEVSQKCGTEHLEAVAVRPSVSSLVTNELMRCGNVCVWERLATNSGADLTDKTIAFLVNRARENEKIQYGLIDRPDLPKNSVVQLLSDADERMRAHLEKHGRKDLLTQIERTRQVSGKRVLSTSSMLGFEFEEAYRKVLNQERTRQLTAEDLMSAAQRDDFPVACCIFARLTNFDLTEAVNMLSRRELDPALLAFRALDLSTNLVSTLLRTGPWKQVLAPHARTRALHAFEVLDPAVAKRIFAARNRSFTSQKGAA